MRRLLFFLVAAGCSSLPPPGAGEKPAERPAGPAAPMPPVVEGVDLQPLAAQAARAALAMRASGAPLPAEDLRALDAARDAAAVQRALDRHALVVVHVNPEQRVAVTRGPVAGQLDENGWRSFLVKVVNQAGTTAPLAAASPQAAPIYRMAFPDNAIAPRQDIGPREVAARWLALELHDRAPLAGAALSGLEVEYRVLHLYCADRDLAGGPRRRGPFRREATLEFDVGAGTQDLAHRAGVPVLFTCRPSVELTFDVKDERGRPTVAAFVVTDRDGRTYPAKARRLAPDFFFHPQVYRRDGESLELPPGRYRIAVTRGPEYAAQERAVEVGRAGARAAFRLERWIDPAAAGWISGDHHIHAAGCVHYEVPTQGVKPDDIWRHVVGEDLKIGAVLTWGPCYGYQKQFFSGRPHRLSTGENVLRYDVEVSGWSSHKAGHLALLGLTRQDYPGAARLEDWPRLGLEVLRWAKAQGATTGVAHTGWGLEVPGSAVPSLEMPRFDGIGAMEYVVQVTHTVPGPDGTPVPAIDFLSAVDTPYVWELSMWYHALNAGFRTRIAGETDFPCIYDDRVGMGRSYVKLDRTAPLDFEAWRANLAAGRSYVSDGRSHILDFEVGGVKVGEGGSELRLPRAGPVAVTARVAALLPRQPDPATGRKPVKEMPYWHLERARIGASRDVPVELVVNGKVVATRTITASGELREVSFPQVRVERSSWIALRVLPSSHSNPVFVLVGGRPVRGPATSVRWLLAAVDAVWKQKSPTYRADEMAEARAAYEHARRAYRRILAESGP
ncbi:MAG TPA: CehA/McbA family metallohydrolase [Kofleriaceae bacterium]|nr:CehA/McbA family metallohydrolase [Kofleriaceae bacterium]